MAYYIGVLWDNVPQAKKVKEEDEEQEEEAAAAEAMLEREDEEDAEHAETAAEEPKINNKPVVGTLQYSARREKVSVCRCSSCMTTLSYRLACLLTVTACT